MKRLYLFAALLLSLSVVSCHRQNGMDFKTVHGLDEMLTVAKEDSLRPVLLYVTTGSGKVDSVFVNEVFNDTTLVRFADEKLVCVRADVNETGCSGLAERYGLVSLPAIVLLSPDGEPLLDIVHLGFLGRDDGGDLPCRKPMLRAMNLAVDCLNADDDALFSDYNWKQLQMVTVRLDSKLFKRMIENKDLLIERYGNDFYFLVDYAMSSSAVNLVVETDDGSMCVPHRREAFYQAIDMLSAAGFPTTGEYYCTERYRFYGDVNIAIGLGQRQEALEIVEAAFSKGVATQTECNQLRYQLGQ